MDEVMLMLAIVLSILAVVWIAMIGVTGKLLGIHRQKIAELEAELEGASQQQQQQPAQQPDNADYKRGA